MSNKLAFFTSNTKIVLLIIFMKILIDDVFNLAKGKPTKNKIGSRNIPARLNKFEWQQFEIAQNKGFLVVNNKTRDSLKNIWFLYCQAKNIEHRVITKPIT